MGVDEFLEELITSFGEEGEPVCLCFRLVYFRMMSKETHVHNYFAPWARARAWQGPALAPVTAPQKIIHPLFQPCVYSQQIHKSGKTWVDF